MLTTARMISFFVLGLALVPAGGAAPMDPSSRLSRPSQMMDEELLAAGPIPRHRMELIWLDPDQLKELAENVRIGGGRALLKVTADGEPKTYTISSADIAWAQEIEKIVDFAYAAGQQGRFAEAITHYKRALLLAPGGDLFLMSVGVAFVQLGDKARGIQYLEKGGRDQPPE